MGGARNHVATCGKTICTGSGLYAARAVALRQQDSFILLIRTFEVCSIIISTWVLDDSRAQAASIVAFQTVWLCWPLWS